MSEFREILESHGYVLKDCSRGWRMRPLYRDSDNDSVLFVDSHTGIFYDHKLKRGGSFESLIKLTTGDLTDEELLKIQNQSIKNQTRLRRNKIYDFDFKILKKLKKDYNFYSMQGISEKTLETFRSGLADSGDFKNRYVFPIIQEERKELKIIGFSARDTTYKSKIKWIHMGDTNSWCYPFFLNKENILKKNTIIIVESIGNLIRLWDNGIKNALCSFGCHINYGILKCILSHNIKKVVIAFDNDFPDRNGVRAGLHGAKKSKEKLSKFIEPINIEIRLPPKQGTDIFDLETKEIKKLYEK